MAQQIVCNGCGEAIDETQPYYTGQMQLIEPDPQAIPISGPATRLDYHTEHLPGPMDAQLPQRPVRVEP